MEKEVRIIEAEEAEVRNIKDSRTVEGFGIVFNKESKNLGGFTEIIDPSAASSLIEKNDIFALMNHNINRGVLARSEFGKGSLNIAIEDKGVKYRFDAPLFDLGNELLEGIKRGDIKKSSFSFAVKNDKWIRRSDGSVLRTIIDFEKVFDMSPVYREAYQDTSVAIRSLDEFIQSGIEIIEEGDVNTSEAKTSDAAITDSGAKVTRSEREINLKREHNIIKFKNRKL